jgi:hypothetical protein
MLSTTDDDVAASKTTASPRPASGRTDPAGASAAAGETAACAGEMVGGGLSAALDPQDARATVVTITATL